MTKLTVALRNFANVPKNSDGLRHTCHVLHNPDVFGTTGQLKRDRTRAEIRFRLSAKRTIPFKLGEGGASVQSTTGSRGVRISGTNAGYTMFRRTVQDYWLPTPFASFPFTSPPVRHRVPSRFNWTLRQCQQTLNDISTWHSVGPWACWSERE